VLKNLLDKGKCRLGLHAGDFVYTSAGGCEQERVCPRCGNRSARVVHAWAGWADDGTGTCRFVRRCSRCQAEESKLEHAWGPPRYAGAGSCDQVRPCTRCPAEEPAPAVHVMDAWAYVEEDACGQAVACARCGAAGSGRRTAHDWDSWTASAFYASDVCVCRHCGEMVLGPAGGAGDPDAAVSFTATSRALWAMLESGDPAEVRARITTDSQLLLGPAVAACLAFAGDQLVTDEDGRETLRRCGALLERCRVEGIDAVFDRAPETQAPEPPAPEPPAPEPAPAPAPDRPPALHGHWRSTEPLGVGTGFSMSIDTNLVLEPDGRFAWWSNRENLEYGAWSASADTIYLDFDAGGRLVRRYQQSGSGMIFPDDSRYRFWQRV